MAKNAVSEAAALRGGLGNAIPSAAEGAFENFLIGALTRGRIKIPAMFGKGVTGKVATGVTGGAVLGGSEEAIEQVGQNIGSNIAVGGTRPITADTLQQFVMGAIAEGVAGGGGAALQHTLQTPEQKTDKAVQDITSATSVDAAIATATQAAAEPVYESYVSQSILAEGMGVSEKVLKEEPAYLQREAQHQQEIDQAFTARDEHIRGLDEQIAALTLARDQAEAEPALMNHPMTSDTRSRGTGQL